MITLHIAVLDKFIPPIIELIRSINTQNTQFFYTYGDKEKYPYNSQGDSIHKDKSKNLLISFFFRYIPLLREMYKADKIILHGLFDIYLIVILALNPWLLKKCYWLVWGGDLYYHDDAIVKSSIKKRFFEFFRRIVIKRVRFIVTYIPGDFELAKKWYNTKSDYIECYMYLSNIPRKAYSTKKNKDYIAIQVGNSADPTNNHTEILNNLSKYKNKNIKIYIPLSYGDENYANEIKKYATSIFHDNVYIINKFLPYNEYIEFLNEIDIAIFNHNRQQAMGNILMLLNLGKTVYINYDTTQWSMLHNYGFSIKDTKNITLNLLSKDEIAKNIKIIEANFTKEKLISQYKQFL